MPGQIRADHAPAPAGGRDVSGGVLVWNRDLKAYLKRRFDLSVGLDLNLLYQHATAGLPSGPRDAFGGAFRFYGHWALIGRGTDSEGSLVWKVEYRSRLGTDVAPNALGTSVGSLFPSATSFADWRWGVTNLEWQQQLRFGRARAGFALGQVDATDWLTVLDVTNPWTGFVSTLPLAYPTNPVPNQGLGAMAFVFLRDRNTPYVMAGLSDANGEPTRAGFDTFFDTGEYYSYAEVGWTPSYEHRYDNNVRLTYWHVDPRTDAATPEGWGLSATAACKPGGGPWSPFVHVGRSFGGLAWAETALSLGTGYDLCNGDKAGVAASWAHPSEGGLRDQYSFELFYNLRLDEHLALTPDLQVLLHPAANPEEDVIAILGVRLRLDL